MANHRPFRFGVAAFGAQSYDEWVALARTAEALGYAIFLMPDHFQPQLAPLAALMAVADATSTLRIGSLVFANDFRHPTVLAKEAATLDLLSGGRFEIGIGAGWAEADYTKTGLRFDPPGARVSRLAESVQIMKGLFGDAPVTFAGRHYEIAGLNGFPKPLQRPHPPMLLAGSGKRMLSLAAREADIIGLLFSLRESRYHLAESTTAMTAQRIAWVQQAAEERFRTLEFNTLVFEVIITQNRMEATEHLAQAWGVTNEQVRDTIHILVGTIKQITEEIQRWRERFGISYITILQEHMAAFAPVVARLAGT
jgi:probable F420-dependent oxidoreductase